MPHQGPGIDPVDRHNPPLLQVYPEIFAGAEIAANTAIFSNNKTGQMGPFTFPVLLVDSIVSDLGICHRDNLTTITRIGKDLLITGHRGVKTDLTIDFSFRTERLARKDRTVLEHEFGKLLFNHVQHLLVGLFVQRQSSATSHVKPYRLYRR